MNFRVLVSILAATQGDWVTEEIRTRYCFLSTGIVDASPDDHDCSVGTIEAMAAKYARLREVVVSHINATYSERFDFFDQIQIEEYRDFIDFTHPPLRGLNKYFPDSSSLPSYLSGSVDAIRALIEIYLTVPGVNWDYVIARLKPDYRTDPRDIGTLRPPLNPEFIVKFRFIQRLFEKSGLPEDILEGKLKHFIPKPPVIDRLRAMVFAGYFLRSTDAEQEALREAILEALDDSSATVETLSWLYTVMDEQCFATWPVIKLKKLTDYVDHHNREVHNPEFLGDGNFTTRLRADMPGTDWAAVESSTGFNEVDFQDILRAVTAKTGPMEQAIVLRVMSCIAQELGFSTRAVLEMIPTDLRVVVMSFEPQRHHYLDALQVSLFAFLHKSDLRDDEIIPKIVGVASRLGFEEIERNAAKLRSTLVSRRIKLFPNITRVYSFPLLRFRAAFTDVSGFLPQ